MATIAQGVLAVLQEQVGAALGEFVGAACTSQGDFSKVETAAHALLLKLRPVVLGAGLRASVASADRAFGCTQCGRSLSAHSWRERQVVAAEGEATLRSVRYRCRRCGKDYYPLEAANGLSGSHFTTQAKGLIAQRGAEMAYARTAAVLEERGIRVSAKEVDRTTTGRWPAGGRARSRRQCRYWRSRPRC